MFRTEPVLTEPCFLTEVVLTELMFFTELVPTEPILTEPSFFLLDLLLLNVRCLTELVRTELIVCTDLVPAVLEQGADVDSVGDNSMIPLVAAACDGHLQTTRVLLENGADCKKKWAGKTALAHARSNNHSEVVALLEVVPPFVPPFYSCNASTLPPASVSFSLSYILASFLAHTSLLPSFLPSVYPSFCPSLFYSVCATPFFLPSVRPSVRPFLPPFRLVRSFIPSFSSVPSFLPSSFLPSALRFPLFYFPSLPCLFWPFLAFSCLAFLSFFHKGALAVQAFRLRSI
jgi:hypothetical protein